MESSISTSAETLRSIHCNFPQDSAADDSQHSSPRSSALPSPPDSPSADSVSSFPSVSSSFFFSSGAPSPSHPHSHSDHSRDSEAEAHQGPGLIIPSLTLPTALRLPTAHGKALGDLRLLVLPMKGAGEGFSSKLLLDDNDDVVDAGTWEENENGKLLRASTDWIEHRDPHGLERFEACHNVEILELDGYDPDSDLSSSLQRIKRIIEAPFRAISEVIVPTTQSLSLAASLVSSSTTPLYTALVLVVPTAVTSAEEAIIDDLSSHIPIVLLSKPPLRLHSRNFQKLAFTPSSSVALRTGLFRSPEMLSILRSEAADRFLRWREVERAVDELQNVRRRTMPGRRKSSVSYHEDRAESEERGLALSWSKSKWEQEWEATLSEDVARRLRESSVRSSPTPSSPEQEDEKQDPWSGCGGSSNFDPLHLPSLLMLSLSLLAPARHRVTSTLWGVVRSLGDWNIRLTLLGGFCIGVGVGLLARW